MKNKIFFSIILCILLLTGCNSKEDLMKSYNFKDIVIDEVTSLEIIKYTIGGQEINTIDNHDEILKKYNYLNDFKIAGETSVTCEDNTVIYNFKQNNEVISIQIECGNVLLFNNKRFELEK